MRPAAAGGSTDAPTDPTYVITPGPTATGEENAVRLVVRSSMTLRGLSSELTGTAKRAWMRETRDRIEREARGEVDGGTRLDVVLRVDDQEALAGGNDRRLRSESAPRLRIDFTTTIEFNSDLDWSQEDGNSMVSSGFETKMDQEEYVATLRNVGVPRFEAIDGMTMEVDGRLITEEEVSNPMKPVDGVESNNMGAIIGGAVGGGVLLLAMALGVYYTKKKNGGGDVVLQSSKPVASSPMKSVGTSDKLSVQLQASGGRPPPMPQAYGQRMSASPHAPSPPSPQQEYFGTIESRECEHDDVSTLGDPYFGEGAPDPEIAGPQADNTVAESAMSSEQEMYVFGVGRDRLMTGGSSSRMESTAGGGGGGTVGGPSMFGDDTALEDAYRTPGLDGPADLRRLRVVAPPGKLGIVVDNRMEGGQTQNLPVVHAIKDSSVLVGRVSVGDLLVSVDEVDCRGMSAAMVSRLISSRSENASRAFVLLRGSSSGGML